MTSYVRLTAGSQRKSEATDIPRFDATSRGERPDARRMRAAYILLSVITRLRPPVRL